MIVDEFYLLFPVLSNIDENHGLDFRMNKEPITGSLQVSAFSTIWGTANPIS